MYSRRYKKYTQKYKFHKTTYLIFGFLMSPVILKSLLGDILIFNNLTPSGIVIRLYC